MSPDVHAFFDEATNTATYVVQEPQGRARCHRGHERGRHRNEVASTRLGRPQAHRDHRKHVVQA